MSGPLLPEARFIASLHKAGGPKLLGKLLRSFLDNSPVRIAQMRDHLAAGEVLAAGQIAHKIKSSTGQLGMTVLQALGQELETAAGMPEAEPAALAGLVASIDSAFHGYCAWAETALKELTL